MQTKLIIGLGNPGEKYKLNRHNIGFMVIDSLSNQLNVSVNQQKNSTLFGLGEVNGQKIILAKPLTFMNESGQSVSYLLNYYKIEVADLLIVYDDFSLDFGKLRLRKTGSSGGHNGVKSVIAHLGQDFNRLKVGIGAPAEHMSVSNYVLSNFLGDEIKLLPLIVQNSKDVVKRFILDGIEKAIDVAGNAKI